MKPRQYRISLFILFILMTAVACRPGAGSFESAASSDIEPNNSAAVTPASDGAEAPVKSDAASENLPALPLFQEANANGIGNPLPGGTEDPFAEADFVLNTRLPQSPQTAVVEQHTFGELNEAKARALADQFGFTGPLYIQQIAPEYAPPEGEEGTPVFTAFDGPRILNISYTGVTYEDRAVAVDYNKRPDFAAVKPMVEAQLKAWGLLDFPYELQKLPTGDLVVYRLIDNIRVEQNAFNFYINQAGEFAYFDYQALRSISELGNYPLQTAEMAWQQLQTANGRAQARYDLLPPPTTGDDSNTDFINPRSWAFPTKPGQEVHLYMTPAVYEATDGSGPHLMYGALTLAGDEIELAEIATHLADVLHVWGKISEVDGAKFLNISGWEKLDKINYETLEGTIAYKDDQALLQTVDGETFILAAVPEDLPEGVEGYVNVTGRRDTDGDYPVLDWMSINEKIEWPDVVIETPLEELTPVKTVTIDAVTLIYFTLYQTVDSPNVDVGRLFVPTWKFTGTTDQNRPVTFWVSAVAQDHVSSSSED